MTDRRPYSRVYWSIIDDPKFAKVYDDDRALACWTRLLLVADQAWPASAPIPLNTHRPSLQKLVDSGLIDLGTGFRFRLHGLDKERGERKAAATRSGSEAEPHTVPTGSQPGPNREAKGSSRARAPRLGSSSLVSESPAPERDGLPHLTSTVAGIWEQTSGRSVLSSGNYVASYLDDACLRHPPSEVGAAILRARKQFDHIPDGPQLISAMRPILDPFVDPKAAAAKAREAEERAARERGVIATLRRNHELGGHQEPHPRCPLCSEDAA